MIKRILAFTAAMVTMLVLAIPTFAATCSYANGESTAASGEDKAICTALGKLYGTENAIPYNVGSATDELTYAITITTGTGIKDVYVKEKTTINDVNVAVGSDGKLNISGMGTGDSNIWNQIFSKYKNVIVGISGVATITLIVFFIKNSVSLGQNASNPNGRSSAIQGILWTGISAAILGSATIFLGFFYNAV